MSLQEILTDLEYLTQVAGCCGGKDTDYFRHHAPWELPVHYVYRHLGCCSIIDEICPVFRADNHPLVLGWG